MHIGSQIIVREKVSSTNDLAASLLDDGKPEEGTVIITGNQFDGKGQQGNIWESEPGMNLTFSIILYPEFLSPDQQFYISMVTSLGILDLLSEFGSHFSIKWPNDIYYRDDKIAGILIENTLSGNLFRSSIAGIGININQKKFGNYMPKPVSISILTGEEHDTELLLGKVCSSIEKWYKRLSNGKFSEISSSYESNLYLRGVSSLFIKNGRRIRGTITGVDKFGRLLLLESDGTQNRYGFREIAFDHDRNPSH